MATSSTSPSHLSPNSSVPLPPTINQQTDDKTTLLAQALIARAKETLPPNLGECINADMDPTTERVLKSSFEELTKRDQAAQAPLDITHAKRLLAQLQIQEHALGQPLILTLCQYCCACVNTSEKALAKQPGIHVRIKAVEYSILTHLLHILTVIHYVQQETFHQGTHPSRDYFKNSSTYQDCRLALTDDNRKIILHKRIAIGHYPPVSDLCKFYDACWSLYLECPEELVRNVAVERRLSPEVRARFLGNQLLTILALTPKLSELALSYCECLTATIYGPIVPPFSFDDLLDPQNTQWLKGMRSLGKWLAQISPQECHNQQELVRRWKNYVEICQRMANNEYLSPVQLKYKSLCNEIAQDYAAFKQDAAPPPLRTEGGAATSYYLTSTFYLIEHLDRTTMIAIDYLLDLWLQLAPPTLDFATFRPGLERYCTIKPIVQKACESPFVITLGQELHSHLSPQEPWYRPCIQLIRQISQIMKRNGIDEETDRCFIQLLNSPNSNIKDLNHIMTLLYASLNENRRNLLSIVQTFETLFKQLEGQDDLLQRPSFKPMMELTEWFTGIKTLQVRMISHAINEIMDLIEGTFTPTPTVSDWVVDIRPAPGKGKKAQKKPEPAAPTSPKKTDYKKKKSSSPSKESGACAQEEAQEPALVNQAEPLSLPNTPVEEPSPVEWIHSSPSLVSQCVPFCQIVGKDDLGAQAYLANMKIFLHQFHELSHRPLSAHIVISKIDAMRRGVEYVLRALLSHHSPDHRDRKTHDLEYFTYELLQSSTPGNVMGTLKRSLPFLRFIAQANEALHYPLTSQLRDVRLRDLVASSLEGDERAITDLEQVAMTGLQLIHHLLEAAAAPTAPVATFDIPKFRALGPCELVEKEMVDGAEAPLPLETPSVRVSHIRSTQMALVMIDQLREWITFIQQIAVAEDDPQSQRLHQRNNWLIQAERYLKQLTELFHLSEQMAGLDSVVGGLSLARRALKALLQAALYHNAIKNFNQHENNPRILANLLGKGLHPLPRGIGAIHGLTTSPAPNPMRNEGEDILGIGPALCELSEVGLTMAASPDEDGYQIGGKRRTLATHKAQLSTLWTTVCHEMIFPSLSSLMDVCKKGFC